MFSNSMFFRLMEIYDRTASMVTSALFNAIEHVVSTRVFQNRNFQGF